MCMNHTQTLGRLSERFRCMHLKSISSPFGARAARSRARARGAEGNNMDHQHFCRLLQILFLLLMIAKVPTTTDARPLRNAHRSESSASRESSSELVAGNEFLKLFLEHDEHKSEGDGVGKRAEITTASHIEQDRADSRKQLEGDATRRLARGRSLRDSKRRNTNERERSNANDESKTQVVVTSGSKIVFFEDEYNDENAAVADAIDIELQRETQKERRTPLQSAGNSHTTQTRTQSRQQQQQQQQQQSQRQQKNPSDEVKVVAVSISSSSKRQPAHEQQQQQQQQPQSRRSQPRTSLPSTQSVATTSTTSKLPLSNHRRDSTKVTTTTTTTAKTTLAQEALSDTSSSSASSLSSNFINRSHRSELVIEEGEPLTMPQIPPDDKSPAAVMSFHADSVESASTNIRKVLSVASAHAPAPVNAPSAVTSAMSQTTKRNRNSTRINHSSTRSAIMYDDSDDSHQKGDTSPAVTVEDKLLPFQTVIYHDTKEGHGPQSRSISYSSISQNVDDLQAWQRSGILAEAQRNVSESLKPAAAAAPTHSRAHSEPAKFYSVPSKMYSVPSKFYSEPAKVYGEPSKVYGEPEKFYSEPAKVYGEPSKVYSEPAKVYSQPAKVYSEPAKTYWPRLPAAAVSSLTATATTTPTTTTTTTAPIIISMSTTVAPFKTTTASTFAAPSTRRAAIVSRIAFGEAQATHTPAESGGRHASPASHHQRNQPQRSQNNALSTQPRRVLSNLDKLPYDLLNAPGQSQKHLLASAWNPKPACGERAATTLQQHQRSSLLERHSNQNAKGLANEGTGDLVKCTAADEGDPSSVRRFLHTAAAAAASATTERSHVEEFYAPTPEQNYEIEESVSVMTNGRAHGVRGPVGLTATTARSPQPQHFPGGSRGRAGIGFAQSGLHRGGGTLYQNAHANVRDDDDDDAAVEANYDEEESAGPNDKEEGDAAIVNNNNNNNSDDDASGKSQQNGANEDDSKVAYVVEGRNYRKYRVEEKTDDGFIVGEYGVVDHSDGNLRGVRYTADSTINRSLIQKALLTFLKLK